MYPEDQITELQKEVAELKQEVADLKAALATVAKVVENSQETDGCSESLTGLLGF